MNTQTYLLMDDTELNVKNIPHNTQDDYQIIINTAKKLNLPLKEEIIGNNGLSNYKLRSLVPLKNLFN